MVALAFLCVIITQTRQIDFIAPLSIGLTRFRRDLPRSQVTSDPLLARIKKFRGTIIAGKGALERWAGDPPHREVQLVGDHKEVVADTLPEHYCYNITYLTTWRWSGSA